MEQYTQNNIPELIQQFPILTDIQNLKETFWLNPRIMDLPSCRDNLPLNQSDVQDAAQRLKRFAPYIAKVFPETAATDGIIESPVQKIPDMQKVLAARYGNTVPANLLIKLDSHLPISGSIKARGGIYEVLKFAEETAIKHNLLTLKDDYSILQSPEHRQLFNRYSIAVGSTGNLGLSIGIMGAKLGFRVIVHMSADARTWKKEMLRSKGVQVIEHQSDYSQAVAGGRKQAEADPYCHFIDDEDSLDLFLGYAVAAQRLAKQLEELSVQVDDDHPLFVYLPCGVGGGPGGITYGLKLQYGSNVHCFFGEPTQAPAMITGLATTLHDRISAKELGISGKTDADGLAVSRPSGLVTGIMAHILSGSFTVSDEEMYRLLAVLYQTEKTRLEPSALAGFSGTIRMKAHLDQLKITAEQFTNASHLIWATGGSMVPVEVWKKYYEKGVALL